MLARGTLVLSTDPAYPPQSSVVEGATRLADTKCAPNQLTAAEVEGYDADTGKLVAAAMGVEPCFVTPPWSEITAGNWGDRWDIAWGSGALTKERMTRLWVTQPYYSTPHNFFVPADSTVQDASELSGKEVGACAGCTQELYLKHELELPGVTLDYAVTDPKIVTFDAEPPGLAATAAGDLAAFLCGEPVGTEAIKGGAALRMLATPAYVTQKTGYLDRGSTLSQTAFAARVDEILQGLHADGSLKAAVREVSSGWTTPRPLGRSTCRRSTSRCSDCRSGEKDWPMERPSPPAASRSLRCWPCSSPPVHRAVAPRPAPPQRPAAAAPQRAASLDPEKDQLAHILDRGTLVGYHEADYKPHVHSTCAETPSRPADTKCQPNQLTGRRGDRLRHRDARSSWQRASASRPASPRPTWTEVTGGNWGDRLDIAYGSGSINADRMSDCG